MYSIIAFEQIKSARCAKTCPPQGKTCGGVFLRFAKKQQVQQPAQRYNGINTQQDAVRHAGAAHICHPFGHRQKCFLFRAYPDDLLFTAVHIQKGKPAAGNRQLQLRPTCCQRLQARSIFPRCVIAAPISAQEESLSVRRCKRDPLRPPHGLIVHIRDFCADGADIPHIRNRKNAAVQAADQK